jgi:hypothetical protein
MEQEVVHSGLTTRVVEGLTRCVITEEEKEERAGEKIGRSREGSAVIALRNGLFDKRVSTLPGDDD